MSPDLSITVTGRIKRQTAVSISKAHAACRDDQQSRRTNIDRAPYIGSGVTNSTQFDFVSSKRAVKGSSSLFTNGDAAFALAHLPAVSTAGSWPIGIIETLGSSGAP